MRFEDHIAGVETETVRFAAVIDKADLTAPVPGCPGFDIAKLAGHVGHVHRWVTHIIASDAQAPVGYSSVKYPRPDDPGELGAWLVAGAAPLLAQLGGDPDAPVWGFGGNSRRWWARRMVHEMTVHRADAELAMGLQPEIDPDVAVDGVDEFLHLVSVIIGMRGLADNLKGSGETFHLHATDAPGEWTITLGPDGMSWERGHSKATTAIRGKAADLLLLMYSRYRAADAERFQVFGDPALAERWAANTAV